MTAPSRTKEREKVLKISSQTKQKLKPVLSYKQRLSIEVGSSPRLCGKVSLPARKETTKDGKRIRKAPPAEAGAYVNASKYSHRREQTAAITLRDLS
jgi:hypothetical protein